MKPLVLTIIAALFLVGNVAFGAPRKHFKDYCERAHNQLAMCRQTK